PSRDRWPRSRGLAHQRIVARPDRADHRLPQDSRLRAITAQVSAVPIIPPLRRDLCAVVAAGRPPTGAAQALLDLLAAGPGGHLVSQPPAPARGRP
ncbi:MAG TPA: hypothetical protein DEH11_13970, partial [Actinobacteria bacterium]|nr:hypothetical protein [Actinomycetota bacterium]